MSELNNQPGLFDQEFEQGLDQELELNEQNPTLSTAVPLLTYLLSENRIRIVDVKYAEMLSKSNSDSENTHNEMFYLVLLLCLSQQSQHSCLTLSEVD